MDKFWNSRLFRCLVCLVLVCCILVNISPLKAEASAIVAGATVSAAGVFATLFAMSMGVVFVDLTANLINGLGDSFVDHVTKSTSTDNETEILKVWIEPIQVDLDSGGISQLPPDQDDDTNTWGALAGLFTLPDELKDNFLDWGKSLIKGESQVEVEEEVTAPDGQMYYNGYLFPPLPPDASNYPCAYIGKYTTPYLVLCENVSYGSSLGRMYYVAPARIYYLTDNSWGSPSDYTSGGYTKGDVYWSSVNVDDGYGGIFISASEASSTSTTTVPVLPDTYVGDIPQKVQNGDFDDDQYELPYINPTKLWENQTDAVEALRDVATQLQNGSMNYDQYMEQIQTETSTDPGGSGSTNPSTPGDSSDPDETTPDETQPEEEKPVEDLGNFTLDLSDYFPFCIPFDLYDFFACLAASPEAPVIHWEIVGPGGSLHELNLDLSPYDSVAQLLRRLQLLLFCVGLAFKTRDLIKG